MGLFQWAVETYDRNEALVGVEIEGEKAPLAPIGHIIAKTQIEVTIDQNGNFISASSDEKKVIIPVTEDSAARSGKDASNYVHPLSEQLVPFISGNDRIYSLYVDQMAKWANSGYGTQKLDALLKYVMKNTIVKDLSEHQLIKYSGGEIQNAKDMIRWIVVGLGEAESGACWKDQKLMKSWEAYYTSQIKDRYRDLCMIMGVWEPLTLKHPKGIVSYNNNFGAKLISSNDSSEFTYRGRFCNDKEAKYSSKDTSSREALSISYLSSQKLHNALRWLVDNQGVLIGGRTYICWCPQGIEIPRCTRPLRRRSEQEEPRVRPSDFQKELRDALNSWKNDLSSVAQTMAVIAAFDAATTGRLAVTYYNELSASDFLERLYDWDVSCAWVVNVDGQEIARSPYLKQIVECAYGTERSGKIQADDRVLGEQMQRLVRCRIDRQKFPTNILRMLTQRASEPQKYQEKGNWRKVLFTACAAIRKCRWDYSDSEEVWEMALEEDRRDRSYQFGRLLAILEKIERDTYRGETGREPNAIRRMSVYCKRPYHTFVQVEQAMEQAYLPHLSPGARVWYKQQIAEILGKLDEMGELAEEKRDLALEDSYLLGYYLQRAALYKGKSGEASVDSGEEKEVTEE